MDKEWFELLQQKPVFIYNCNFYNQCNTPDLNDDGEEESESGENELCRVDRVLGSGLEAVKDFVKATAEWDDDQSDAPEQTQLQLQADQVSSGDVDTDEKEPDEQEGGEAMSL
ncbi:LO1 protein [Japanese eel endothelial cells-infecting virus]|uniref:LO1 protein n=1 Tax=Japanese eel endothelial cells-infecting virus TaxID=712037 RepID=UPI00052E515E|nr:LO1 protein [Japanese eel endothelial cells-infecting virus]